MLHFYVDMDGVLCNFDKKVKTLGIVPTRNVPSTELSDNERIIRKQFWHKIAEYKESFWEELEPFEDVLAVIDYWQKYPKIAFSILTKVPSNKECHDFAVLGKKKWLVKHFRPKVLKDIHIIDGNKTEYCKSVEDILIDDRESNCIEWQKAGGTAIFFKDASQLNNAIHSIFDWIKEDEIS